MKQTIYKPLWQTDCGIGYISNSLKLLFSIQGKHDVRERTPGHRVFLCAVHVTLLQSRGFHCVSLRLKPAEALGCAGKKKKKHP